MKINKLNGLISAPFTPMHEDGTINLDVIPQYAGYLIENNVKGVFLCGTTGESFSLTNDERIAVIEEWVKSSRGELKIISHIGALSQADLVELAIRSRDAGVDAVAAMSPFFFKPVSIESLIAFFEPLASFIPDMPFYYYNIPSLTGVNLPVHKLLQDVRNVIPNLVGVKYTHNDLMDLQQCMSINGGEFDILYGSDETLICGLSLGVKAAVGSTYNFMAPVYNQIFDSVENGNMAEARKLQGMSVNVVKLLFKYGGPVIAGKAIMEMKGVPCGPVRLPLNPMSESEKSRLYEELIDIGFFEEVKSSQASINK